jgi:hypothetical protein
MEEIHFSFTQTASLTFLKALDNLPGRLIQLSSALRLQHRLRPPCAAILGKHVALSVRTNEAVVVGLHVVFSIARQRCNLLTYRPLGKSVFSPSLQSGVLEKPGVF